MVDIECSYSILPNLVPRLIAIALPATFRIPAAVDDLLAVVLEFVVLVAVRSGWQATPELVWLLAVEELADSITATAQGLRPKIAAHDHLGIAWLLPTCGVPAFVAIQLTVIALLLNH